jgi:hypothetical protein
MRLTTSKVLIMRTILALHYRWLELHNSIIYYLFSIKTWHILSLLTFSGYLSKRKEKKRKEKKREQRKKEKSSKAQALACLMSIALSFVFALCY